MFKSCFIGMLCACIVYLLSIPVLNSWSNEKITEWNGLEEVSNTVPTISSNQPTKTKYYNPQPQIEFFGGGKVSWFGGPNDHSAAKFNEGQHCSLYPKTKTKELSGNYCAIRFPKKGVSIENLRNWKVYISALNGKMVEAYIADWGPAEWTDRLIDLSPELMKNLGIKTDDHVRVWIEK